MVGRAPVRGVRRDEAQRRGSALSAASSGERSRDERGHDQDQEARVRPSRPRSRRPGPRSRTAACRSAAGPRKPPDVADSSCSCSRTRRRAAGLKCGMIHLISMVEPIAHDDGPHAAEVDAPAQDHGEPDGSTAVSSDVLLAQEQEQGPDRALPVFVASAARTATARSAGRRTRSRGSRSPRPARSEGQAVGGADRVLRPGRPFAAEPDDRDGRDGEQERLRDQERDRAREDRKTGPSTARIG